MRINRIAVARICFLVSLLFCLLTITACSVNWVSEVQGMIPVVGAAAAAFIGLLAAFGTKVPPDLLAKVNDWEAQLKTDLGTLSELISEYDAAQPGTGRDGILAEIDAVATIIVGNFNAILPELHIDNPASQAKVTAIANAILVQLEAITAIIPVVKGQAKIQQVANAGKLPLSGHQFTTSFNQLLAHGTGDAETDAAVEAVKPLPVPVTKA